MARRDRTELVDGYIDLRTIPFTVRYSRLLVLDSAVAAAPVVPAGSAASDGSAAITALAVCEAAYERDLRQCVRVQQLRLTDADGQPAQVAAVDATGLLFTHGGRLTLTADDEVVLSHLPAGSRVATDREDVVVPPGYGVVLSAETSQADYLSAHLVSQVRAQAMDCAVRKDLDTWMARCPKVQPRWQEMVRRCWWTLGANTLRIDAGQGPRRCVVPSKLGYVGLWQWDAYFIAIGLRWGDPALAAEQLEAAVAYQRQDGQLPDVVHDGGVLASSDDLPPADLARLRELASPALGAGPVPLTKPPLLALAAQMLADSADAPVPDRLVESALASQEWWYRCSLPPDVPHSRLDACQPVYLHPYSSGLDDSPVFDHDALLASPDLAAYLIVSDRLAAGWLEARGRRTEARRLRDRAAHASAWLQATWDEQEGLFPVLGEQGQPLRCRTILSLMPLLDESLPHEIAQVLADSALNPDEMGTPFGPATVARTDPDFSPTRMWRGPVWVNTAWLVIRGLRSHGLDEAASRLTTAVLETVALHGPCEYFRADDGSRSPGATVTFGWSAALAIDLAVSDSPRATGSR